MKLSVVLAAYNEEVNLARCLDSVKDLADEIVIVDGESVDKTVEIGKRYGAKIIETTNKPIFHINKQMGMDEARGDWVLQLDADEVVDAKLRSHIKKIVENGSDFSAFWIKRKNMFLGRWLTKGGQYPDKVIRFYKNGQARLPQKSVHEQMEVEGRVGEIDGHLLHYNAPTFSRYLTNADRYTSLTAQELQNSKTPKNIVNMIGYFIVKPSVTFLNIYIRHKGFVDGMPGFIFALFSGLHWSLAYMKLWDVEKKK